MLTEADLQELRDVAFDRLLLQVWPRFDQRKETGCMSCGSIKPNKKGFVVMGYGLCVRCYKRWRAGDREVIPGPAKMGTSRQCDDALLAKRVGVCVASLHNWRNDTAIPLLRTLRRIAASLEAEFGVPADMWFEALSISNAARGNVLMPSGKTYAPEKLHRHVYPLDREEIGKQFSWWMVLSTARRHKTAGHAARIIVNARCLLCMKVYERQLGNLIYQVSRSCKSCSRRFDASGSGVSGLKGVHRHSNTGRWIVTKNISGAPYRSFGKLEDAGRYYDAAMYERYGHTLFLNFPDEYDRSNDPAFVPVSRPAAGAASPEPAASAPTRRSPLPAGGTAQHRL